MREFTDGDFPHAEDFDSLTRTLAGTAAVLSGCAVDDGGTNDMTVSIASGTIYAGGGSVSVASSSETLNAADGTYRRYDLITADSTGATNYVAGTASASPQAPDIPAGEALLAIIKVDAGVSGVTNADIKDARGTITVPEAYLDFDPATQTELNNHAGNSSAHHTKYSPPSGIIVIWSGAITGIPSGWVLCDGMNGTPNLQDRFVVGAGGAYAVDATGGASTHTLTTAELASHAHTVDYSDNNGTSGNIPESNSDANRVTNDTRSSGGDSAHENKPPYYALAYIMKT